jgi:hypothetical protein
MPFTSLQGMELEEKWIGALLGSRHYPLFLFISE